MDHALPAAHASPFEYGVIPVELQKIVGGVLLEILLFVEKGYLSSLELVWYGDEAPSDWPDPRSMEVVVTPEPT